MITLIMGSMYSGKTSELLRRLERFNLANKKTVLLRPKCDDRGFLSHTVHNLDWLDERYVDDLLNIDIKGYDAIGVDEGQFHNNLAYFCKNSTLFNKNIIVSALHATSECEMFEPIVELIPYCDKILKLNAVCMQCGSDFGNYTFHKTGKSEKSEVGGKELYEARCAHCYYFGMQDR